MDKDFESFNRLSPIQNISKKGQNKNNSNRKSNLEERLSRFFSYFFFCLVIDYYFNGKQLFENRLVLWKETIIALKQVQKTFSLCFSCILLEVSNSFLISAKFPGENIVEIISI